MIRSTIILLGFLSVELLAQSENQQEILKRFEKEAPQLFTPGDIRTNVMKATWTKRFDELSQKLQMSIARNAEWWLEHVKKAEPGKPLPYDPRLGLSKDEYEEYLSLSKEYSLKKQAVASLKITLGKPNVFSLDGGNDLNGMTGISIDVDRGVVVTPFGVCREVHEIHTGDDFPFPWDGYEWKLIEEADLPQLKGKLVQFTIGKLRNSEKRLLTYRAQGFHERAPITPIELIIEY